MKHPRFQQEYKEWNEKISCITDEAKKTELTRHLQNLVGEVRRMDSYHNQLSVNTGMSASVTESRQAISDIRKKIHKQLAELEAAGLIEKQCS